MRTSKGFHKIVSICLVCEDGALLLPVKWVAVWVKVECDHTNAKHRQ